MGRDMPQFAYEARTEDGQLVSGVLAAADMQEAGQKLSRQGQFVVRIGPADPTAGRSANRHKVKRGKVMWALNQLAIMVQTGITLGESLESLARQAKDPVMKEVLAGVSHTVQEGRPLSDAMEAYPRTFPVAATAMIRASEASGTLGQVLHRVAHYMLKDEQAMQRLRAALMYPAFVFFLCVSVTLFLMTVILPKFVAIYEHKGATLPLVTRMLIGASRLLTGYWPFVTGVAAAAATGLYFWLKSERGRAAADALLLRLPLMGPLFNKLYQSRSFRAVGTLLEVGVPLSEVLLLARDMSPNHCYRQLWTSVHDAVTRGEHVAVPLAKYGFVPEPVRQMIDCGDRSGRLAHVFGSLGGFIEEEYDQAMRGLCQLLEPAMIVFIGGIIGFVALALLLPMFGSAFVASH